MGRRVWWSMKTIQVDLFNRVLGGVMAKKDVEKLEFSCMIERALYIYRREDITIN
jgi:hypothetical protein